MANDEAMLREARLLLRAARVGTLATVSADGRPFASLVTPAVAMDGSVLLLLSSLAEHTRHLKANPACALLVSGPAPEPNPQTTPRVTVNGHAALFDDAAGRDRFLAVHPYASLYAGFADFGLWRIAPDSFSLVGGFARAARFEAAALAPDAAAVDALGGSQGGIIAHCNADHADAMALIGQAVSGRSAPWRMVGVDTEGVDLADDGDGSVRAPFAASVTNATGVRTELVALVKAVRG